MMKKRIVSSTLMLLLASQFSYANGYTLSDANHIIVILIVIVIALIGFGCYSVHHNREVSQRNEQLRRILAALDDYRAHVGDGVLAQASNQGRMLSLDEQEENQANAESMEGKEAQKDDDQSFFVKMDARINKEKPFTDPNFDHAALVAFMEVTLETFCKLVPRYTDPDRTLDYINSLRAEYAAKMLIEHSDYSIDDIATKCGFRNTAAFNKAFKFSFGITPTDYLGSMSQMFKKKEDD